ncbi:MAG: type IX secretion system sortase PorU [Bacteroidales bacterium]|nr:type IX secretion system sortase PorU [Bacteroidales bacterium]MDD4384363.1 type IX secretion system sortase PorU [Bacteroidales bacterium]MDY0198235.1 type IX secretion system sortase PorU [Tenuifilaceae bacterium]
MSRFACILCFLLISSGVINGQTYSRSINWPKEPMKNYRVSEEGGNHFKPHLRFDDNVDYPLSPLMIPFYTETIPVSDAVETSEHVSVTFAKMEYADLTPEELELLSQSDIDSISKLSVKHSVYTTRRKQMLQVSIPALRVNPANGRVEKLLAFSLAVKPKEIGVRPKLSVRYTNQSVLSNGVWKQVRVDKSGVFKISYAELVSMGFANPDNVSVWGHDGKQLSFWNSDESIDDLRQIPIFMEKGSDNIFNQGDYILFYANGPITWGISEDESMLTHRIHDYALQTNYFLTTDMPVPLRIVNVDTPSSPHTRISNAYDALHYFEINDTNLIKSGRQWLGESFDIYTSRTYNLPFNKPVANGKAHVRVRAAARSSISSTFTLRANGSFVGNISLPSVSLTNQYGTFASLSSKTFEIPYSQGSLNLDLIYNKPTPSAKGWLDYITVNARQSLIIQSGQFQFRDLESVGVGNVTRFDISNADAGIMVWDITNFFDHKKNLNYTLQGSVAQVKIATDDLKEMIAFNPSQAYKVSSVVDVDNQDIHGAGQPDMFIVTHPDYLSQANELAQLHIDNSGLDVVVYTNQQVYNEFSSGNADVAAIRNMMRMFYKRASNDDELPRYLLLFGDGSYKNLSTASSNTNRVLTYQSEISNHVTDSYVSDDFFGLLDDNEGEGKGLLDIGIGRIPSNTVSEANIAIAKIRQYMLGSNGSWHNQLCFIGDDGDGNVHMSDANLLGSFVETNYPRYNVQRIFFDAYPMQTTSQGACYPDVTDAINSRANQGALIINYVGHANTRWLSHEKVLMVNDIQQWRNFDRLPLFVTATCEFSRFDDFASKSAGEHALFVPNGGSVGLLSTTRVVYSNPNYTLNRNFFQYVFAQRTDYVEGQGDRFYRLGDVLRLAKVATSGEINKRNFMLLGDPALMLHYPDASMSITQINGTPITGQLDTLRALNTVELKGIVSDSKAKDGFVGEAEITLFDKAKEITTLANRGGTPFVFTARESTIYKGRSTVVDNGFIAKFIIPKDIMYDYGYGRISLYASDGMSIGAGYFEDFTVGGISDNIGDDTAGPQIELFMNNDKFVPGGTTDASPKLIVSLVDSSGINTTGVGIGHNLVATISGDEERTIVLNDYYISDVDNFKQGKAEYQLSGLKEGEYKVTVKAWDVFNNSSEAQIDFNVLSDTKLKLTHLLNYPNPFTQSTGFYFEHNQPYSDFDISIQIFSPSGKLVKTIEQYLPSEGGYRVGPIYWDGLDDFGDRIGRGVYFYKIRVKPTDGKVVEVYQKLVVLK